MKKLLSQIKTLSLTLFQNMKSKAWWKAQMKTRDNWIWLYGFWIIYGGWLLMKVITNMVYDLPATHFTVANGYAIGFIWFVFYCMNSVSERDHRKTLWKFIDLYRERGDEYLKFIQELKDAVDEAEKEKKE